MQFIFGFIVGLNTMFLIVMLIGSISKKKIDNSSQNTYNMLSRIDKETQIQLDLLDRMYRNEELEKRLKDKLVEDKELN